MSSIHTTPTGRKSCHLACPGDENSTPKSAVSQSSFYGSLSRNFGHRSLDAVRSVRGTIKGRRAFNTITNAAPYTQNSSCCSSPAGSATKQRWYDSIRPRASQIPMPISPVSMSPTIKQRLFKIPLLDTDKKTRPVPSCVGGVSPAAQERFQEQVQSKSDIPAPSPEQRKATTFRACSNKAIQEISKKYGGEVHGRMPTVDVNNNIFMTLAESIRLNHAETMTENSTQEIRNDVGVKCDVHYPPTLSMPPHTEQFEDTSAALSNYCLNNMLCGSPVYSNVIIWSLHKPMPSPSKIHQSFIVLPNYLKPDRNALGTDYQWAIIVFRSNAEPKKVPGALREQEKVLQAAIDNVVKMGYQIDIWTKSDNYCWREAKLEALGVGDCKSPDQSLREKYQAMVGHGIPGFSSHEIEIIDDMLCIRDAGSGSEDSESVYSEIALRTKHETEAEHGHRSDAESELNGFLEHQEESIAPGGSDAHFKTYDDSHFSGVSEDLDMVTRLGGKPIV